MTQARPNGAKIYNLGNLIREDVERHRLCLIDLNDGERRFSYDEIDNAADTFGRNLIRSGLQRGDCVAIVGENCAEFLIAYMGTMRAGCTAVPINFRLPLEVVRFIFEDSNIKLCIADAGRVPMCPQDIPLIMMREIERFGISSKLSAGTVRDEWYPPATIAEILYTSGSTGRPKGVALTHEGQLWALGVHVASKPEVGQRVIIAAPMYHMNALFNISCSLMKAVEVVIMPRFDARLFLCAIVEYKCTMLSGIPTMFALMAREQDLIQTLDFSSVESVSIGSAPLTEALIARIRAIFPNSMLKNGYGATECGPSIFGDHPYLPRPLLSVGYPLSEVKTRLVGTEENQGVLEVSTPAMFAGYLNLPDGTREKLRDDWYCTGDIMRRDQEGFFYFVGRADDMFICGGENVYPGEIEKMLERHPSVVQAAVLAVPDELKGQIPIAFVVVNDKKTSEKELKDFALKEGPAFSHPRAVSIVDKLPLASTHKLDKRALMSTALELARALNR